ncbi:MAG: hypothetical protein Crog4KO_13700 [Crocinitomicaceae bacterium]
MNLKTLALMTLLLSSSSAFCQLTVEDDANSRTNGLNDGVNELTYNFPLETNYKLMQRGKIILLEGSGDKVNLGVLAPGEYFMLYEQEDGRAIMDRFEVTR